MDNQPQTRREKKKDKGQKKYGDKFVTGKGVRNKEKNQELARERGSISSTSKTPAK